MTSEKTKTFFDQKCFINICFHEKIQKPEKELTTGPDGKQGYSWKLPYRASRIRYDQDNKGKVCNTYDVVFHNDIQKMILHVEFKKFVADTAIDGISQVLAEDKEKISRDYRIMNKLTCKGDEPSLMTIRVNTGDPLIDNMELDTVDTRLQKEIEKTKQDYMSKEEKEAEAKRKEEEKMKASQNQEIEDEEEEDPEEEEVKPTGIVQPKYKIVHQF